MNSAIIKENLLKDNKAESRWLADYRKYHYHAFQETGLPNSKNEYWKYTDLSLLKDKKIIDFIDNKIDGLWHENAQIQHLINRHRFSNNEVALLVMIDGVFSKELSQLDTLSGVLICSLKTALENDNELLRKYWPEQYAVDKFPFACMNAALFNDGMFMHVFAKCEVRQPIHILSIATGKEIIHPRNLMLLDKDSRAQIFEECVSLSLNPSQNMINTVTTITLDDNARLHYIKIQSDNTQTYHFNYSHIQQKQHSEFTLINFLLGTQFTREDIVIDLTADYAKCNTHGFYQTDNHSNYLDHHLVANHLAPHTESNMLFKGLLQHDARAVFNGRVYVKAQAQKIVAQQANHNLLIAKNAEIFSKPELEIYADDVKCKHGSTVGQIDPLALFYLRTRGVELEEAKNLLLQGFAKEIIQTIDNDFLKMRVEQMVSYYAK